MINKMEENKLLRVEHDEYGIWYFTDMGKFAKILDVPYSQLQYHVWKKNEFRGWTFEWVDGADVVWSYINPTKERVEKNKDF